MKPKEEKRKVFIYKAIFPGREAKPATMGVKFSTNAYIMDEWWLFGGTRWTRTIFRLKHPIIYSKRGLRILWRKVKHLFVKEPPSTPCTRKEKK